MTEAPEYSIEGFGLAPIRSEGEATPWAHLVVPPKPRPWLVRVTQWPRRKVARQVERLANWICRDRDEGW